MSTFDDILNTIHDGNPGSVVDEEGLLIIDETRQISLSDGFNPIIAYEGDVNSQVITIQCIRTYDKHNLSECSNKELKWTNIASGQEGVSKLHATATSTGKNFSLRWEVPAEMCTQSGTIEISVSFYDIDTSGQIAYRWNTASFSGLSIGKTTDSIERTFPPKNEILIIDSETKSIIAPAGYNNIICVYGDAGMTQVYFLVNRYIGKGYANNIIDVLDDSTNITLYVSINNKKGFCKRDPGSDNTAIITTPYSTELSGRNNEGLVLITWNVPGEVTTGDQGPGTLEIMFEFANEEKKWKWYSNSYASLKVGENKFAVPGEGTEDDSWHMFEDYIESVIDKYFTNNDFIINANDE